jgi:hypothetical protein
MCKKEFKAKTTVARTENHQRPLCRKINETAGSSFFVVGIPPKLICAEQ